MKANLLSLFRVYQLTSQSQSLQSEKVTLPSVSSFKAFVGLKTSGLASGKKILLEQDSSASRELENGCDEPAISYS